MCHTQYILAFIKCNQVCLCALGWRRNSWFTYKRSCQYRLRFIIRLPRHIPFYYLERNACISDIFTSSAFVFLPLDLTQSSSASWQSGICTWQYFFGLTVRKKRYIYFFLPYSTYKVRTPGLSVCLSVYLSVWYADDCFTASLKKKAVKMKQHTRKKYGEPEGDTQCMAQRNWDIFHAFADLRCDLSNKVLFPLQKSGRTNEFPCLIFFFYSMGSVGPQDFLGSKTTKFAPLSHAIFPTTLNTADCQEFKIHARIGFLLLKCEDVSTVFTW
jgi:hypothetical protein